MSPKLIPQLQSRIAKRRNHIRELEQRVEVFKSMLTDPFDAGLVITDYLNDIARKEVWKLRAAIKPLAKDQQLDRAILSELYAFDRLVLPEIEFFHDWAGNVWTNGPRYP